MHSTKEIEKEAARIYKSLRFLARKKDDCRKFALLTLEINRLKKEQNAIILAHSYQHPEIIFGVADFVGDSFGLSKQATQTKAQKIIFSSVEFMAETAKILNPGKQVLVPKIAGCSLSESINPEDIKKLKKTYPNTPIICYVNTSAKVKAECDICVTSANAVKIIKNLESDEVIFVPDKLMAKNISGITNKKIIPWHGTCIVHEEFGEKDIQRVREKKPNAKILAHLECPSAILESADMSGGTSDMYKYVKKSDAKEFMLVTECGLIERFRSEFHNKRFVGTCQLCKYMKEIKLKDILNTLKRPKKEQFINLDSSTIRKAKKCLDRMMELS